MPLPTMLNFPFSAALLAGGKSSRMGRDKAGLEIAGELLWKRQLAILRQLNPAELFICGRPDTEYPGAGCEVLTDAVPNAGPLGGLVTALRHASTETLLLLAVDMPAMRASFLGKLLKRAQTTGLSIVPQSADGLEPLAAIYRIDSLVIAEERLRVGEKSMHSLIWDLQQSELVELYQIQNDELPLFRNVNTPEELANVNVLLWSEEDVP